ncbi:MAG: AgmX/PglI C-terminal domain-containing protein [Bdellovibrionaceae bacterium]|jgi:periplasmic protein TonB|nr:AgmX/PglI C-terminal domain-containing protein [Pseudobdellovibrionaceae bacterium]
MMKTAKQSVHIQIFYKEKMVCNEAFSKFPITLGSDRLCDICLSEYSWVSAQHASILPIGSQLCIVDTQSESGILLNGNQVFNLPLKDVCTVHIGELKIIIKVMQSEPKQEPDVHDSEFSEAKKSFNESDSIDPQRTLDEVTVLDDNYTIDETPPPLNTGSHPSAEADPVIEHVISYEQYEKNEDEKHNKGLEGRPKASSSVSERKKSPPVQRPHGFQQQGQFVQRVPLDKHALEGRLLWRGVILDTQVFRKGDVLSISSHPEHGFYVPSLKRTMELAQFDGRSTRCHLPMRSRGQVTDLDNNVVSEIQSVSEINHKKKLAILRLKYNQACSIFIDENIQLELRHIEAPKPFSQIKFLIPEKLFKKTLQGSGILHILFLLIALVFAPTLDVPKVKNLPPRVAKLLIPKKKKIEVKPKVVKPPEIKKVVKKKPLKRKKLKAVKRKKVVRKKLKYKPKKIVVRKSKRMKKINKWPFTVKTKTVASRPFRGKVSNKKSVKNVGALAALGALGKATPNPSNKAVSININKNAGGMPGKMKANSVLGAIKAKGGKLVAGGGSGSLKTFGKGYGTGKGYGVQGIKGRAGGRGEGVAATVVGTPTLMKISRREGLSQKQVMTVVRKNVGKISSCYERALLNNPSLGGRIEYEWKIKPSGKVSWAKVKKSSVQRSDELNNCVLKVFKRMRFPKAKNGEATQPNIGFPFGRF